MNLDLLSQDVKGGRTNERKRGRKSEKVSEKETKMERGRGKERRKGKEGKEVFICFSNNCILTAERHPV